MESKKEKRPKLNPKSKKIQKKTIKVAPTSTPAVTKPPKKSKINRLALNEQKKEKGIVYVGHLPYGFDENGLKEFFAQYGDVNNARLARSKKTGRSKGYGWVEFPFKEVAEIAAQSMHNYVTNGRRLVCTVVQEEKKPIFTKKTDKKFKFINWQTKFRTEKNQPKTSEQLKLHVKKLLNREELKRKKLEELKLNYKFPGYTDIIEKYKKSHPK